eukprot:FR738157.1.p1 GENE.FR738157.1~~FR738157.1.p1  ORF type:complete len:330 (-),score=56.32 FR738157.1:61-1050(-)
MLFPFRSPAQTLEGARGFPEEEGKRGKMSPKTQNPSFPRGVGSDFINARGARPGFPGRKKGGNGPQSQLKLSLAYLFSPPQAFHLIAFRLFRWGENGGGKTISHRRTVMAQETASGTINPSIKGNKRWGSSGGGGRFRNKDFPCFFGPWLSLIGPAVFFFSLFYVYFIFIFFFFFFEGRCSLQNALPIPAVETKRTYERTRRTRKSTTKEVTPPMSATRTTTQLPSWPWRQFPCLLGARPLVSRCVSVSLCLCVSVPLCLSAALRFLSDEARGVLTTRNRPCGRLCSNCSCSEPSPHHPGHRTSRWPCHAISPFLSPAEYAPMKPIQTE